MTDPKNIEAILKHAVIWHKRPTVRMYYKQKKNISYTDQIRSVVSLLCVINPLRVS